MHLFVPSVAANTEIG